MTDSAAQLAPLWAGFWTAVLAYRGERPWRFVAGLALGAVAAHLDWARGLSARPLATSPRGYHTDVSQSDECWGVQLISS